MIVRAYVTPEWVTALGWDKLVNVKRRKRGLVDVKNETPMTKFFDRTTRVELSETFSEIKRGSFTRGFVEYLPEQNAWLIHMGRTMQSIRDVAYCVIGTDERDIWEHNPSVEITDLPNGDKLINAEVSTINGVPCLEARKNERIGNIGFDFLGYNVETRKGYSTRIQYLGSTGYKSSGSSRSQIVISEDAARQFSASAELEDGKTDVINTFRGTARLGMRVVQYAARKQRGGYLFRTLKSIL